MQPWPHPSVWASRSNSRAHREERPAGAIASVRSKLARGRHPDVIVSASLLFQPTLFPAKRSARFVRLFFTSVFRARQESPINVRLLLLPSVPISSAARSTHAHANTGTNSCVILLFQHSHTLGARCCLRFRTALNTQTKTCKFLAVLDVKLQVAGN